MSQCPCLPFWISVMQALAVPILAVVVALFGVLNAGRQTKIAREKLQNDEFYRLYDRRVAVYEATRNFLAAVFQKGISDDVIRAYGLTTLDAQFLFDEKTFRYLSEIRAHVATLHSAEKEIASARHDEQVEWKRIRDESLDWIRAQGDEATGFATRFAPFLMHK